MLKSVTSLTNGVFFQKGNATASGYIDVISNGNVGTKFDTQKGLTTFYWGIENI